MTLRHLRQNAVAYLALVVALSTGTSYAAAQIANGSVTTKKLAKDAVVSKKVKNGSLRGIDVLDGSLTAADLAAGSVGSGQLLDGSVTDDDLGTGSVGSAEVKNGSLTAPDLAVGSVGSGEVKDGSLNAGDLAAAAFPKLVVTHGAGALTPVFPAEGTLFDPNPVTVTRAGQVYVRFTKPSIGNPCSVGAGTLGLYVNAAPVPGTSTPMPPAGTTSFIEVVAAVDRVPGTHTFTVGVDCEDPAAVVGAPGGAGAVTWTTITPGA